MKGYVVTGTRTNVGLPTRPGAAPIGAAAARMHRRPPGAPSHPGGYRELSGREVEVLRLVAEGQSNKAIGVSMGLSALTVKSHLARIARKLGTGDRAGDGRRGPADRHHPLTPPFTGVKGIGR